MTKSPAAEALDHAGFGSWFRNIAGTFYSEDPWTSYARALEASKDAPSYLRPLVDLFICNKAASAHAVRTALGESATSFLHSRDVLRSTSDGMISALCLISSFDLYLFLEWPISSASGRFISRQVYLSSGSYECGLRISVRRDLDRAIDLGSGSGLITMLLSQRAKQTVGLEINETAVALSKLSLEINGLSADIVHCDWNSYSSSRFNLIVVNPPWRIVPPNIIYPSPIARLGTGPDGLDKVRRALRAVSRLLAFGGEALVRFDLPEGIASAEALLSNPAEIMGAGFSIETTVLGDVSIDEQALTSADTCSHLNPETEHLDQVFLNHYRFLNVRRLVKLICTIRNENSSEAATLAH